MSDQAAARVIARDRVDEWIAALIKAAEVIAPTTTTAGDVVFAPISAPAEVRWDFENALHPPKQFALPQTEPLVRIGRNNAGLRVEPVDDGRRRVLFNVRNCDVAGMQFLRRVHGADLPDDAYLRRAERLLLVSLSCPRPCRLGFCICTGSGPFLDAGFDVQLTDLGETILAEPGSDAGEALLAAAGKLFRPATAAEGQERSALEAQARQSFGDQTCHFASAMRRVSTGRVSDELWSAIADWCFECGGCTLACPTCYCFSVKDRPEDDGWTRCRIWDSCQYGAFTLEASGHNPRQEHKERVKRRFFHKVSAQYFQRDEAVGCVGCGRCITVCLGTTHMPAVVAAIRAGEWNG